MTVSTNVAIETCLIVVFTIYVGVSKSSQTSSTDRQRIALRECVRCAWEQGTSPLSVPSGVAVWILGVAQHKCLSPRVPSHLRFQHGWKTGAKSKHQILRQTWQIWRGDFWNDTTCVWKWGHVSYDVFQVARALQERQNINRRRREVRTTFHELNTQKCGNNSVSCAWGLSENH
jgi:hypothetical protein